MQYILDQLTAIREKFIQIEARLAWIEEVKNPVTDEEIATMKKSIDEAQAEAIRFRQLLDEFVKNRVITGGKNCGPQTTLLHEHEEV